MFSSTNSPFPPYYFPSSSYPPPSLPPPPLPPPIVNQEPNSSCVENNIFLYQNHHFDHQIPLSTHPFFFSTNTNNNNSSSSSSIPQILIPETLINLGVSNSSNTTTTTTPTPTMTINKGQDSHASSGSGLNFSGLGQNFLIKKASKKDRHSKIYTAQGLRDRRVRLSIEIAREFFDLHDMLGFDKASKTLEWLLTKSKKAIKEVSRSKHYSNYRSSKMSLSNSTTSECEEAAVSEVNEAVEPLSTPPHHHHHHKDHHQDLVVGAKPRDEEMVSSKNIDLEKLMLSSSSSSSGLAAAKDSRAMARARARARTKEKRYYYNNHCTSNTTKRSSTTTTTTSSGISTAPCLINSSQILNQFKSPNFTSETTVPTLGLDDDDDHHDDDRNESSAVIKWSKLTLFPGPMNTTPTSSSTYGHHHHHHRHEEEHLCGISKGESNSSDNIYSPMITLLPQNWDMNGTTATTTTTTHASGRPVGFRLPIT